MIRWGSIVGIAIVSLLLVAGCRQTRARAPELRPPSRPELTSLTAEQWRAIEPETRVVLTDNQEKIHQYVEQLELLLLAYETWRTSGSQ